MERSSIRPQQENSRFSPDEASVASTPFSFSAMVNDNNNNNNNNISAVGYHTFVVESAPDHAENPVENSALSSASSAGLRLPQVNKEAMIALETALQLHGRKRSPPVLPGSQQTSAFVISLETVMSLAQKLSLATSWTKPTSSSTGTDLPGPDDPSSRGDDCEAQEVGGDVLEGLSAAENLVYLFLCIATPTLYSLRQHQGDPRADDSTRKQKTPGRWYLEPTSVQSGRLAELQALMGKPSVVSSSQCEHIRHLLIENRRYRRPQESLSVAVDSKKPAADMPDTTALLSSRGTTVEERVRARAEAKRKYQEMTNDGAASTTASLSSAPAHSTTNHDPEWLIRVADALWSHAHDVLVRQTRFQSPRRRSKLACCSMTLKDVLSLLARSMSISTASGVAQTVSRRDVYRGVIQLARSVPEWIVLSNPVTEPVSSTEEYSAQATVWIKPMEYNTIRRQLLGQDLEAAPSTSSTTSLNHTPQHRAELHGPPHPYPAPSCTTPHEGTSTLMKAQVVTAESIDRGEERVPSEPMNSPTTTSSEPRTLIHASAPVTRSKRSALSSDTRRAELPEPAVLRSTKKRKVAATLRINPHLILTDADHDGGERIEPTQFDSPRGLKNLFYRLNAGQRI